MGPEIQNAVFFAQPTLSKAFEIIDPSHDKVIFNFFHHTDTSQEVFNEAFMNCTHTGVPHS